MPLINLQEIGICRSAPEIEDSHMIKTRSERRILMYIDRKMVSRPRRINFGASKNAKTPEKLEPISKTVVTPERFSRHARLRESTLAGGESGMRVLDSRLNRAGMTIVVTRVFLSWLLVIALIEIYTDGEWIK